MNIRRWYVQTTTPHDGKHFIAEVERDEDNFVATVEGETPERCLHNAQIVAKGPEFLLLLRHVRHCMETPGDFSPTEKDELLDDICSSIEQFDDNEE